MAAGPSATSGGEQLAETTFVAPEGVYSMVEEHRPINYHTNIASSNPALYPTRLTAVLIQFPASKAGGASQGLNYLLSGGKEKEKKDKDRGKDKDKDGKPKKPSYDDSLSSSENLNVEEGKDSGPQSVADAPPSPRHESENGVPVVPSLPAFAATPFTAGPPLSGKKKSVSRPKHNIRTTSSSFVTRLQSMEGLNKVLSSKQGDVSFLFYNSAKSLYWTEVGNKSKVGWLDLPRLVVFPC